MDIEKTQSGDKTILSLSGRLDAITAPQLQDVLIPELNAAKQIELDFSELAYVSSAGLRVLLMGEKTAKGKGGSMTLAGVSEDIMEVLKMTGLDDIFHFA